VKVAVEYGVAIGLQATECTAVAFLGQERSPQPPRQQLLIGKLKTQTRNQKQNQLCTSISMFHYKICKSILENTFI